MQNKVGDEFEREEEGADPVPASAPGCFRYLPTLILISLLLILSTFGVSVYLLLRQFDALVPEFSSAQGAVLTLAEEFRANFLTLIVVWMALLGLFGLAVRYFLSQYARIEASLEQTVAARTSELRVANQGLTRSLTELDRRHQEAKALNEMGDLLQAARVLPEAFAVISASGPAYIGPTSGAVLLLSASRNLVETCAQWGQPVSKPVFAPEDCWALRLGRASAAGAGIPGSVVCTHALLSEKDASLCLPLQAGGETLGLLQLAGEAGVRDAEDLRAAASSFAEHVAMSLSNLRLRETLRSQSIRDPLTGLFNRRYLEETLELTVRQAARAGTSLSVIMADLDHFKRFNDQFGHQTGDELLKKLAGVLIAGIREGDVPCRYGGEEFTLVLPDASLETAVARAEEIRKAVEDMRFSVEGGPILPISGSFGVAAYPLHGASGGAIIAAADAALYRAKQAGRNRVAAAENDGDPGT